MNAPQPAPVIPSQPINRTVDVLDIICSASVALRVMPEVPGFNGSILAMDDDVAKRHENALSEAFDAVAKLLSASRNAVGMLPYGPEREAMYAALANIGLQS